MAGGGAPAPKADEPQPHPPKDQLPNISYCITSPPPWRQFLLSSRFVFALFGFVLLHLIRVFSSSLLFVRFSFLILLFKQETVILLICVCVFLPDLLNIYAQICGFFFCLMLSLSLDVIW